MGKDLNLEQALGSRSVHSMAKNLTHDSFPSFPSDEKQERVHEVLITTFWLGNPKEGKNHGVAALKGQWGGNLIVQYSHIQTCAPFNYSNCYLSIVGRHPEMFLDISVFDCFNGSQTPYSQQHVV